MVFIALYFLFFNTMVIALQKGYKYSAPKVQSSINVIIVRVGIYNQLYKINFIMTLWGSDIRAIKTKNSIVCLPF